MVCSSGLQIGFTRLLFAVAFGSLGGSAGCTSKTLENTVFLKAGQRAFQFQSNQVTELTLVKMNPQSGENWSLRVVRSPSDPGQWSIAQERSAQDFLDLRADSNLIVHLIDTLQTLQVLKSDITAPKETLGLAPAWLALRWTEKTSNGSRELEWQVGAPVGRTGDGNYSSTPGADAFVSSGAAHQMLDYIDKLESLRLKTWTAVEADDIDEVEWKRGGKSVFYAQREGSDWKNRQHQKLKQDVSAWLERLTHQRVQNFISRSEEGLRTVIERNPLQEVVVRDRLGREIRLLLGKKNGKLFALSSARPNGIFEVYPDAELAMSQPLSYQKSPGAQKP